MGGRPKVVVDVQFQGRETEYEVVHEQFEFELVGSRIHVKPCAADHPQGAAYSDYPRKRPASPRNEPYEISRAVKPKKSQEEQSRSAKAKSRSPSPTRRKIVEHKIIRCRDRSTSPCTPSYSMKTTCENCDERFPARRQRPQRSIVSRDDSDTSFSSFRDTRTKPKQIRKETSMWNISKKGPDNYSIGSSASLGDVNCGSIRYCIQQENDGNYSFTARGSKNNDRAKFRKKNLAVQVGYDEDLRYKRLKQFSDGRNKNELIEHNRSERDQTEFKYDRYNNCDMNDEEPRSNRAPYQNRETKRCTFSCHPCCSEESPPAIIYEEYEMFASTETFRPEPHKYNDQYLAEEGGKRSEVNRKQDKVKVKKEKPENKISNEPEEHEEPEVNNSNYKLKYNEQKSKKKDKYRSVYEQKPKKEATSKPVFIKDEDTDDDTDDDTDEDSKKEVSLKSINLQPNDRHSPQKPTKKEPKKDEREMSAQSKKTEKVKTAEEKKKEKEKKDDDKKKEKAKKEDDKKKEKAKKEEDNKKDRVKAPPKKVRLPETEKKEEKKEESKTNLQPETNARASEGEKKEEQNNHEKEPRTLTLSRNCCRKSLRYSQAHLDK